MAFHLLHRPKPPWEGQSFHPIKTLEQTTDCLISTIVSCVMKVYALLMSLDDYSRLRSEGIMALRNCEHSPRYFTVINVPCYTSLYVCNRNLFAAPSMKLVIDPSRAVQGFFFCLNPAGPRSEVYRHRNVIGMAHAPSRLLSEDPTNK